ncbi:MAG: helix-turn-helix transcriptional regulator [Clostridia bacterium]|mgnify:CR=1 FL=1|nr:helix-turn-helix transcriptional regulator [Clostridia bacterium]
MSYYKRIRELREDCDKTQKEIADVLDTTYQYYSAYERGLRDIPFQRVITLAKYYNVSLDYIAELTDNPKPNTTLINMKCHKTS